MTPDSNIPAGWVLVPVEATIEMIDQGGKGIAFKTQGFGGAMRLAHYSSDLIERENRERADAAYRAMLNAAPKAPDSSSFHSVAPPIPPLPLEAAGAAAPSGVRELVRSAEWLINRAEEPAASVARAYLAWLVACPVEEDDEDERPHDEC